MASLLFPDTGTRMVVYRSGAAAANQIGQLFTDEACTTPAEIYADNAGTKGALIASSSIPLDKNGEQPDYWGPVAGTDRLYIRVNGIVSKVDADYNARIDAVLANVGATPGQGHTNATNEIVVSDTRFGTPGTRAAFIAALDAAEALGRGTVVRVPAGMTVDVGNGLSLSGYSVQIKGAGAGLASPGTTPNVSVIKASTQTGPVLDFTGYVSPYSFRGKVEPISGVMIQGSGVADPAKANVGLLFTVLSSAYVHDVAIMGTGGPCMKFASNPGNAVYLSDFERIILHTPISAGTNDVPYFVADEPNGNRFRGIGFRAAGGAESCGASGAAVITSNASFRAEFLLIDAWWFENLDVLTNGTLVAFQGNGSTIRDVQFFDCDKTNAANTGTSYIRLTAAPTGDGGGNIITGLIPGKGTNATDIDCGVDIRQSWNTIIGAKGYKGNNVVLASGVDHCNVQLTGGLSGSSNAAWTDNSGSASNHLIDEFLKTEVRPAGWTVNGIVDLPSPPQTTALDHNLLSWTYDIGGVGTFTALSAAGVANVIKLPIRQKSSVTNIVIYIGTAGSGLTSGQCFAALYSGAGTLIGVTTDQAAAWAGNGVKTMALQSGPFSLDPGFVYVALWYNGTTSPLFARSASLIIGASNVGLSAPNLRYATADTGLTTTAPSTLGGQTAASVMFWAAIS